MKLIELLTLFLPLTFLSLEAYSSIPEGLWRTTCHEGLLKLQEITPTQAELTEIFHQDRDCQHPSFQFKTSGDIISPQAAENQIDFTYTQVQLTLGLQMLVEDFNLRQVCGFSDWKIHEPKTITGLACALFNLTKPTLIPAMGAQKFGIYKIENEKLFFGQLSKENDGSTNEKRPLYYDLQYYLKLEGFRQ